MNAFLAILRPTVENLASDTQEARMMVYARAREAVLRRLAEIDPPPSEEAIARQLAKLEDAITELEYGRDG